MATIKKKLKLCILHSTLHIGGAEEVTANICRTIDKDEIDVTVCCLKEMGLVGQKILDQGTKVINLASDDKNKTDYFTSLRLRKYLKNNNYQLIHSHDVHSLVDASICRITIPSLRFIHTFHFGNYPHREPEMVKFERLFWRVPDKLVAVSEKQNKDIRDFYNIPNHRIKTVWNGVDVISADGKLDITWKYKSEGKVVIGSINTLIEQKGMFDLIAVADILKQKLPNKFVFIVAGDGPLKHQLEEQIKAKGLDDYIKLLGWVDSASSVVLPGIDIFFQPSLWEAMSMVLLEAMATRKAIVTTSVGETPRIMDNSDYGIVVNPGDKQAMSNSLLRLIEERNTRENYGENAGKRYEEYFTAIKMSERYASLYQELTSK